MVASEEFKNRVIQLGEEEHNVHNIGAMGVENVMRQDFLTEKELEETLGIELEEEYYVVLFHPGNLRGRRSIKTNPNTSRSIIRTDKTGYIHRIKIQILIQIR